jgi:CRISPR/Cas system-associated exonuclease Cas4 (RecB family)
MTDTPWHLKNYKETLSSKHRIIPAVEKVAIKQQLESTRDTEHLHPSEICKKSWCPRSSWYTIKGYERVDKRLTFQTLNVFEEGHLIHRKWQSWMKEAGILESAEVPIYDPEHLLMGHADAIINDKKGRALVEIKSVGAGTIRYEDYDLWESCGTPEDAWKKVHKPFYSHLRQLNLYMYCTGIHDGIILYEWKATQEVKEFHVKHQPELIADILSSCKVVIRSLESGIPPMRPSWMEDSSNSVCKYCPYKNVCWKDND